LTGAERKGLLITRIEQSGPNLKAHNFGTQILGSLFLAASYFSSTFP